MSVSLKLAMLSLPQVDTQLSPKLRKELSNLRA